MKRCYLIRHGQTAWNLVNRIQGSSDRSLNALGRRQAERVGAFFASRHLKGIFTSHLRRSRETAAAIAAGNGHGVAPIVEQALAEMHLGTWEGLTPAQINARFKGAYRRWQIRPSAVRIPEGEPLGRFRRRASRALERILASAADGELVIVSHGGVIAAMLADLLRADYDALLRGLRLDNAGITALDCGAGSPRVLWINSTSHLDALHGARATRVGNARPSGGEPRWRSSDEPKRSVEAVGLKS